MDLKEKLKEYIKIVTDKTGYSQEKIALDMGYGKTYISEVLSPTGTVSKKFLRALETQYSNCLENPNSTEPFKLNEADKFFAKVRVVMKITGFSVEEISESLGYEKNYVTSLMKAGVTTRDAIDKFVEKYEKYLDPERYKEIEKYESLISKKAAFEDKPVINLAANEETLYNKPSDNDYIQLLKQYNSDLRENNQALLKLTDKVTTTLDKINDKLGGINRAGHTVAS